MPRELCFGNGDLMVTLDADLAIRDLYFPFVGMENHVGGHRCRFGVWVDGRFAWVDEAWGRTIAYRCDSLLSEVVLTPPALPVELAVNDTVHPLYTIFLRRIAARSTDGEAHDLRLFFSQDLHVHESSHGVPALYHPHEDAVIHYRKDRYVLAGARGDRPGLDQYAVGTAETRAFRGTWVDAEDGVLSGHPVAHGSADSTIGVHARIEPTWTSAVHYWLCTGTSMDEVTALHRRVRAGGPGALFDQADQVYRVWVNKSRIDFADLPRALELLEWVCGHANRAGLMPEQLDPRTGVPLSVAPLTWSHSTFVLAVTRYLDAVHGVTTCPTSGLSAYHGSHTRPWF